MIQEQFTLTVSGKEIAVEHSGRTNMDEANKQHLVGMIEEDLRRGTTEAFYPYGNFECSVSWKLTNSPPPLTGDKI